MPVIGTLGMLAHAQKWIALGLRSIEGDYTYDYRRDAVAGRFARHEFNGDTHLGVGRTDGRKGCGEMK